MHGHYSVIIIVSLQGELISSLETLGCSVGAKMMERSCKDVPRFRTELDAMIFLCKQFWVHLFNKQVDNLKTNNQVSRQTGMLLYLSLAIGHVCSL